MGMQVVRNNEGTQNLGWHKLCIIKATCRKEEGDRIKELKRWTNALCKSAEKVMVKWLEVDIKFVT